MIPAKKPGSRMDIGYFAVGICLIWMPTMAVFDLLPAYLGYLLMFRGLYRLADINEDISDARHLFGRMAILSAVRLLSIPFLFGFIPMSERPVMILIVTFSLAILELVTLIPAWKKLSNGLNYLATRHDGVAVFMTKGRSRRNMTEKLTSFSVVFFFIKAVMTVLPESTSLASQAGGATPDSFFYFPYLYEYIGLMRGFASVVVACIGVVWLVRMRRHLRRVMADRPFLDRLREKYAAEVMTRPELFAKRRIKAVLICICIALAFSVDFYLDGVNIMPDGIMGALLLVSVLLLARYVDPTLLKTALVTSTVYTVIAFIAWIVQLTNISIKEFNFTLDEDILPVYILLCAIHILSRLLFLFALRSVMRVLKDVVRRYTGFSMSHHDIDHPDPHVREVHRELNRRLRLVFGIGVLAALSSVIYFVTMPLAGQSLWEVWTFIDAIVQISLVVSFISATNAILEQVEYKYMLS